MLITWWTNLWQKHHPPVQLLSPQQHLLRNVLSAKWCILPNGPVAIMVAWLNPNYNRHFTFPTKSNPTIRCKGLPWNTVSTYVLLQTDLFSHQSSFQIQEIKRVNKLWSDVELSLHENVLIPVNSSQLMTLRSLYPTLNVVQSPSPTTNRTRKLSTNSNMSDEMTASLRSSDSSTSIPAAATTTTTSFQDYFSKIDQQISSSKKSLQSLDSRKQFSK